MHRDKVALSKHCPADFGEMRPLSTGARLCEHCSTPVHDLTDEAVAARKQPGERRCIRYLYGANGEVVRGSLPTGAVIVPARALLTKKRRERWLATAAVATFPLLLEACGDEAVYSSD